MATITSRPFGVTADGTAVKCFTLTDSDGLSAEILTLGGILRSLTVPAADGLRDVVLGFDGVAGYERHAGTCLGAIVGRVAGRISGAAFTLDGRIYPLPDNAGDCCLHGGVTGFHRRVWEAEPGEDGSLTLSYFSPDGEEGFPGNLRVKAVYALSRGGLSITYEAETDAPTLVNLTNHSYFNLNGQGSGTVEDHVVGIDAAYITEHDSRSLPTGVLLGVGGTPFDLRVPRLLRPGLESSHPQIVAGRGYDHNFVLHGDPGGPLRRVATVEAGGLRMVCEATQPGLIFYTANYLDVDGGKGGAYYGPRSGLCLETEGWPDAVHHPDFPSVVLRPGQVYRQRTVYRFERG